MDCSSDCASTKIMASAVSPSSWASFAAFVTAASACTRYMVFMGSSLLVDGCRGVLILPALENPACFE